MLSIHSSKKLEFPEEIEFLENYDFSTFKTEDDLLVEVESEEEQRQTGTLVNISLKTEGQNYLNYPYLSLEKEQEFATIYHSYQKSLKEGEQPSLSTHQKALDAAHQLVMAHMRYVVKLARQYVNYGLPVSDLIQEGAIGLMKAVQHFNPLKDVRLVSFAMHWIKSEIHNYIVKNWRLVKIATTKSQRKLFFNFRKLKGDQQHVESSLQRNQRISNYLDVPLEDVEHMAQRFSDSETTIDAPCQVDKTRTLAETLPSLMPSPDHQVIEENHQALMQEALRSALSLLNARDKEIIQARFFSSDLITLKELSQKFGISVERVRQLEKKALQTLRTDLFPLHE